MSLYARAEGINFNAEYIYTVSDSDTKIKATGEKVKTDFTRSDQRYNLDISKNLFPYLSFATGGIYELNRLVSESDNNRTSFKEQILRPFAELTLNNPIYQAGVTYRKNRIEEEITDLPDKRSDRDEFIGTVGMTPEKLFPEWNFTFIRTITDDHPTTIDQVRDVYFFETRYNPVRNLLMDYAYTRIDTDDKFRSFDTLEQTHFGKIEYARNFLDERLSMNTGYNIRYNKLEVPGSGTIESPLVRVAGLSSEDRNPGDGALDNNSELINGNTVVQAGLNIGSSADGNPDANIGLDFGFALDVDQIRIWVGVDQPLSATVANAFSWTVYTSPDNSTWTPFATIPSADFGTFDNRFEINFPEVNTRFIKVVTEPLSQTTPGAADFQNIFVTEMEAFITVSGANINNETKTTDQNANLNLRAQLGDRTVAGYNLLYGRQDQDPFDIKRTQLTNDLFFNHIFNRIFSITATGQRTDNSVDSQDTITYNYGSSLVASWFRQFGQSLTYSGTYLDEDDGTAYQNSIFLRNNATLYRGWSMFLDTGYGWERPVEGSSQITSTTIRTGTNLKPNKQITINANYLYRRTEQPDIRIGPETDQQFDIQAFYIPFDTLSFFAKLSFVDRDNGSDTFQNYSVNWSPFPDGDLQLFLIYSEILRSENDRKERVVGPSLKWRIGRFGLLDLSYTYTLNDDSIQKTDSNILNANLRIIF
jgi:hypothetical protein